MIEKGRSNNKSLYMLLGIGLAILAGTAYGAYALLFGGNDKAQPVASKAAASAPAQKAAPASDKAASTAPEVKAEEAKPAAEATKDQAAAQPAAPVKSEAKPTPAAPAVAKQQYSILIKKSSFKLQVLDSNKNIVNSFDCSLGKNPGDKERRGDMKTPVGTFKVIEVCDASYWTHDFKDGKGEIKGAYGPWFFYLDTSAKSKGQWDGIGIHGTHQPDRMRELISEGCIRLQNQNIQYLKDNIIRVGTMVTIEE